MILNLKRISEIENEFQYSPIALDAFKSMLQTYISGASYDSMGLQIDKDTITETLQDLGCIIEKSKSTQQLNS